MNKYFSQSEIPLSLMKSCQCSVSLEGSYLNIAKQLGNWKYRFGLDEIIKPGEGSQKTAYQKTLNIVINGKDRHEIQLLSMQAGEIKKITQPTTRKKKIGTGTFFDGQFAQMLGDKYLFVWSLKSADRKKKVGISQF